MRRLHRFGYVTLGELATIRLFYALHRAIYRLSGGRIFSRSVGCPVVLLTTTGRKSGEPRTAPIFRFREGKSIVVVPSNAGKKQWQDIDWLGGELTLRRALVKQITGEVKTVHSAKPLSLDARLLEVLKAHKAE